MVSSPTAKNARIQVVPSNILQAKAIIASDMTRAAPLIGVCLILLCNLNVTIISMTMLVNIMTATGVASLMYNGFPYTIHLKETSIVLTKRFNMVQNKGCDAKNKAYSKYLETILRGRQTNTC